MKKAIAVVLSLCLMAGVLCSCGTGNAAANLTESYYYKVSFNHMAGEYMGTNLTNELVRTESETIALYDNGTFVITFASSLIGTISGDDHDTGYVYPESMYESAVLTGTYTITDEDSLMNTKTISLDSYTVFQHNNVTENMSGSNEDGITFIATAGQKITVNTETGLLSQLFEFYEGQYAAANTSY